MLCVLEVLLVDALKEFLDLLAGDLVADLVLGADAEVEALLGLLLLWALFVTRALAPESQLEQLVGVL